jgi:repressor LexA
MTSSPSPSPSPKRRALTKRQREIFEFLRDKIVNRGYGPTVREIGEEFGIRSPNGVMCHLKALEKKGLIIRESNMSRAIKLADGSPRQQSVKFLGTAVSGSPIRDADSPDDRVEFSDLFTGEDIVTLQVEGTAFTPLGITDGDFMIISRNQQGKSASLVIALDERDHVTICRIPEDGSTPIPAIPGAPESAKCEVIGVLAGVVRKLEIPKLAEPELNGTVSANLSA